MGIKKNQSINASYNTLLNEVKAVLSSGLIRVQKALEYQRVKTYWTIGQKIYQRVNASKGALNLNRDLYQRISDDIRRDLGLELTLDTLRRTIQFYKTYPQFPDKTPLTFTHYLSLMRVADTRVRARLEAEAVRETMSSPELKARVFEMKTRVGTPVSIAATLPGQRGEPYIYNVHLFEDLAGLKNMCVDCGFKIHVPLKGAIIRHAPSFTIGNARYVRVLKEGRDYDVRLAGRKRAMIHTYAARVLRVVDGDTLDALIDVGFGIRVRERLRLKAINAPEINTRAGQKARAFLSEYLSRCPIIIVRTEKAGMYGRWLADLFAQPGEHDPHLIAQEGEYLNQTMLNKDLVVKY